MSDTHTSKLLSLVLRHKPDEIGIALDNAGWVDVDTLLAALASHGHALTRDELDHLVASNDKRRFEYNANGTRIRAAQGHSIPVDLELPPKEPPAILYHGTADRFLAQIRKTGLQKRDRQHVHLSPSPDLATTVGQRHGRPITLQVRAGDMHRTGHQFFLSSNNVWLTDHVPAEFIDFP